MAEAKCSRADVEMVRLHCDHLNGSRPLDRGRRDACVDVVQRERGRDESDARGDDAERRPTGAAIIEFFLCAAAGLCCVRLGNLTRARESTRALRTPSFLCAGKFLFYLIGGGHAVNLFHYANVVVAASISFQNKYIVGFETPSVILVTVRPLRTL